MYTRSFVLIMSFFLTGCSFDLSHLRGTPLVFQDTTNDGGTPLFHDAGMGVPEDAHVSNLEDSPITNPDSPVPVDSPIHMDDASNGLDPDLATPPRGNQVCSEPSLFATIDVCRPTPTSRMFSCRVFNQTELRCEAATVSVVAGTPCTDSSECEYRQACFRGACATICPIGGSPICGGSADCISVGHPLWGVCQTR